MRFSWLLLFLLFLCNPSFASGASGASTPGMFPVGTFTSGDCLKSAGGIGVMDAGEACGSGGSVVTSINSSTGAFIFTGSGVSCTGTTCTFGGGLTWPLSGAADSVTAPDYSWAAQSGTGLYYNLGIGFAVGGVNVASVIAGAINLTSGDALQIAGVNAIRFPTSDTTAGASIAIGASALSGQTSSAAYRNTAVGYQALNGTMTTAGVANVALGYQAGTAVTSGANNTFLGYQAGNTVTTGSGNILIGKGVTTNGAADTNEIAIGGVGLGSNTTEIGLSGTTTATTIYGMLTLPAITTAGIATTTAGGVIGSVPAVSVKGDYMTLVGKQVSSTTATWTAQQIGETTSTGLPHIAGTPASPYSCTINTAASVGAITGLDTGSLVTATWYYVYSIWNGTTDSCEFSASATAPTLVSGYTYYSTPIGAFYYTTGTPVPVFYQTGHTVTFVTNQIVNAGTSTTYTSISLSAVIPPIATSVFGSGFVNNSNLYAGYVASDSAGTIYEFLSTASMFNLLILNSSQTFYYKVTGGNENIYLIGYTF